MKKVLHFIQKLNNLQREYMTIIYKATLNLA